MISPSRIHVVSEKVHIDWLRLNAIWQGVTVLKPPYQSVSPSKIHVVSALKHFLSLKFRTSKRPRNEKVGKVREGLKLGLRLKDATIHCMHKFKLPKQPNRARAEVKTKCKWNVGHLISPRLRPFKTNWQSAFDYWLIIGLCSRVESLTEKMIKII